MVVELNAIAIGERRSDVALWRGGPNTEVDRRR
jgi:hypothetical protein